MAAVSALHDPLEMNLASQTKRLLEKLGNSSPHALKIRRASTRSELLHILSTLLPIPGLTMLVANTFRPILLDLCARFLAVSVDWIAKLEALCLLIGIHPEIFPVLSAFLKWPQFQRGFLAVAEQDSFMQTANMGDLQRLLLAYYRLLQVNRDLPRTLGWPLSPLSNIMWSQHSNLGLRYLAIQCYALQTGMIEGERVKIEKELVGDSMEAECTIQYGSSLDGTIQMLDGWLLHMTETARLLDARNELLEPQNYYALDENNSFGPIQPEELSPLIANVHGVLMLRSSNHAQLASSLISTPTTTKSLRKIALHLSMSVPTLLTSSPSSGKSLLLSHLSTTLLPDARNQIVTIHLADTSLDPRSLLGSYISSPTRPGTFDWTEGVLVRAMREGRWVVFEDIDRASNEVLGMIKPLVETQAEDKWVGGRASMEVPGRGLIEADEHFKVFATRSLSPSRSGGFSPPTFYGAHIFREVVVPSPTHADLRMIVDTRYPRLAGVAAEGLILLWEAIRVLGSTSSTRDVGLRELEKLCTRVDKLLPSSYVPVPISESAQPQDLSAVFTNPTLREDIFLETRDVFFGAGATNTTARSYFDSVASTVAEHLGLSPERRDWATKGFTPEFALEKDVNGSIAAVRLGRTRLVATSSNTEFDVQTSRPFAMHKPAMSLLSRIATAVSLGEPVLLTGETGTGKTSVVTHLASLLRKPLISLNLSNQTESSDIVGGFKPVDARVPASQLQQQFLDLFSGTFSRKKNPHFEESVRKAVQEGKWKRATGLWLEACRLARDRIRAKNSEEAIQAGENGKPRKRRKVDQELSVPDNQWANFEQDVRTFEVQHVRGNGKFAFGFVEGPLVKALRAGHWILLDEVNLASPETLECISSLLHGPTASITLTEQGSLEPIPRHPEFRLFACMNPATDVGKKDLPPNIRSRFTEIDVPPPDADKETLLSIVTQYIGHCAVGDMGVIMDVAEFYTATRTLAEQRELADGTNHRPHFSMRTLARALTFASDLASAYSLRRSLWEGCLMAFTMSLDDSGAKIVTSLAQKYILSGVRNQRSLLSKEPAIPTSRRPEEFVKFGPFYLERGPLPEDAMDEYIMTPSVEKKLVDLARILVTRRFPVLIEGPTSAGKTSSIEYLARRTGHRFVRINNHEHTDIQEYLGTYVSDPTTGKLVFRDGLLVRALREGDWIVLDELNLAPTDVLEALNRLLDDNRELVVPETQEVVRPHPHFMLFATQNPPGLYAGRKVLSRAFRNRFLEVHFDDVPQAELETILCQRCRIAPSYGQRIVSVFRELQKRRQSSRIFESKQGFATLRDLFRWAGRDAINYQELADNGYMLLAERARKEEDKQVVKEVIETVMKVTIDAKRLYNLQQPEASLALYLGCSPPHSTRLVWTSAMQRLFILVARALRFNEPVLLVGETGCGKTSVCQVYAEILSKTLYAVNCHQNTETADLIGGMRPVRNRGSTQVAILRDASVLLESLGHAVDPSSDSETIIATIDKLLKSDLSSDRANELRRLRGDLRKSLAMFEWHDGPLIHAMRRGDVFLMDEISLADDSVLERLNSVLETSRTIVLAERGGDDSDVLAVQSAEEFKLVATMNPGGDYGKKELSPALRNRFTEIWVPPVDSRHDLELIVGSLWRHNALKSYTTPLLNFTQWLSDAISDSSLVGLRDILAWVEFSNAVYESSHIQIPSPAAIFHHAAHMTLLDGLGSLPQMSSYTTGALKKLHENAVAKLQELVPLSSEPDNISAENQPGYVQLGTFSIPKGPAEASPSLFSFEAPTTRDNVMRVVRACQLPKPILLEGSPGVGKTSLISALANACGYELCRINLSDQTDLVDLFGSDLPVEGGAPGEFAWKDAEFLRALQEGRWVLLDEMNLAPQAILEGLNAVLDHRGTVYIPELGRSFTRHPSFRIFAAQNPLHQGGGRKGLPKSFLNRFTKVYVQELSSNDVLLVCRNLFPTLPEDILRGMIDYTTRLNEEVMVKRTFARDGAPWELNLRDLIRWGSLLQNADLTTTHPSDFLNILFLQRFRVPDDRYIASNIFRSIFENAVHTSEESPDVVVSPNLVQVGNFIIPRSGSTVGRRAGVLLQAQLSALEAVAACVANEWLTIMTGPRRSGKSSLVRFLAQMTGHTLYEIPINNATDAADILGSFEELDIRGQAMQNLERLCNLLRVLASSQCGSKLRTVQKLMTSVQSLGKNWSVASYDSVCQLASELQQTLVSQALDDPIIREDLNSALNSLLNAQHTAGRFEWVDGPLVKALRNGLWVCLDGANLCNPSVLDRLNSLCEKDGSLILNERGAVDGQVETIKPHPNFRLFMCVDSHYGELSRAMRNRGVEVALVPITTGEDLKRLSNYYRLPIALESTTLDDGNAHLSFESIRRGLSIAHKASPQPIWPSRLLIGEDSPSSSLLELAGSLKAESEISKTAEAYFAASTVAPYHIPLLSRFVHQHVNLEVGPLSFVSALTQSHAFKVVYEFRKMCLSANPLELLLSQPMDLQMTHFSSKLEAQLSQAVPSIALLLRLFVTLTTATSPTSTHDVAMANADQTQMTMQDRILSAIQQLAEAAAATTRRICDSVTFDSDDVQKILKSSLRLLNSTEYLKLIAEQDILDYSAVLFMANTLNDIFSEPSTEFTDVVMSVKQLTGLVSPSTGLGLLEIWAVLARAPPATQDRVLQLQRAAHALPLERRGLRSQILQLLALLTMPGDRSSEENQAMQSLLQQVEEQIQGYSEASTARQEYSEDPLLLINELRLLAACSLDSPVSNISLEKLVSAACRNSGSDLSRIVYYQHLLWEVQAEQSSLTTIAAMQQHWLRAVWTLPVLGQRHGPSVLLMPIALYTTVIDCENGDKTLLSIDAYEDTLHRRLQSVCDASIIAKGRLSDLASFAAQYLLSIISCFRGTYDSVTVQEMATLALRLGEKDVLLWLLDLLEETKHAGLKVAIQLHLRPTVIRFETASHAEHNVQMLVGELWIALSQMIMGLFVPNTPIDPALLQRRAFEFHQKETTSLQAQIDMHRDLELRTSGNNSNGTIRFLESLLADVPVPISRTNVQTLERGDLHRLQTYWAEVLEFLDRVVPASRIRSLLSAVTSEHSNIAQLENVIQESIAAFCQRLNGIYQDFSDISAPIQTALLGMKLGLRLVVDAAVRDAASSHVQTIGVLLTFPSVSSAERLRETAVLNTQDASFDLLVIKLAGVAAEATILGTVQPFIGYINQLYEQAVGLWLIDCARAEEKEREAQSLYRRKGATDEMDEAAAEEEEFLSIFPEFEDVLGGEDAAGEDRKPAQYRPIIQGSAPSQLFDMHRGLFLQNVTSKNGLSRYSRYRRTFLMDLVEPEAHNWPEELDTQSSAFQISLLHDRLETLRVDTVAPRSYDFYHDQNVPEAKKAAHVLQALSRRLDALIIEWPEQMVLQHLKSRCDVIEKFTFDSPIAKILSALEQLLLQLEDWEMYANRDNSLKNYRQAMIELIIRWRRMELSAWQGLLDRQAAIFVDSTAEWWFRLYNAAVRGVISATRTDTEEHGGTTSLDKFLDDLVPLLDDFMSRGPLGQFIARLDLLRSMERFVDLLLQVDMQQATESLGRVLRVLHFNRCYYEQFESKVSDSLTDQRAVLEKEVQDFIKLASWKDVNVQALRQSAQKTHRQLYKIIRKFRDILRQPVDALLQPSTSSAALKHSTQDKYASLETFPRLSDVPSFPSLPSLDCPEHLINLATTFRNYTALINGRLFGSLESCPPLSVESFAEDIITTSKALADSVIPANLEASRRVALQKNLLTRKRKAWSDLLKELKRSGLSANVKPEVLELTRSQRRICEQIQIDTKVMDSTLIHKAEDYFYRLSSMLPQLRGTLSDHNVDLSTRELQRAVMHIESCFALALRSRTCLGRAAIDLDIFTTLHRRLVDIGADPHIAGAGPTVLPYIVFAQNVVSGLNSALQETSDLLVNLHTDNPAFIVPVVLLEKLSEAISTLEEVAKSLSHIYRRSKSSMCPVLLKGEHDTVKLAFAQASHVSSTLEQWCTEYPHMTTFMQPVLVWLRQKQVPILERLTTPGSSTFDRVIDSTLLTVQAMLKACKSTEDVTGEEERDNYIKDDCHFVCTLSEKLNLERLVSDLQDLIEGLSAVSSEDISTSIARTSPFLDRYLSLAQAQIATQSGWTKSLFKLAYVLCTVVGSVAKDGFCRPQDGEAEEGDGEGQEAGEGTGMGEGTGSENVSKDIQEESQVEGLQGEDAESNEKVERAEEGNAIEMSEDFGGELQDVPPDEEEQEEQSGDESEGEPDEQLADLDGNDEDAIDEKLWGDEQGPEGKDDSGKTEKDHSKKDSGPSETVAKEGEEAKNEKEQQKEQPEELPQEQPVEEANDAPAEDETAPGPDGAPLDEFTQEAETLDLPENMELDGPEKQEAEGGMDDEDDLMDDEPDEEADGAPEPGSQDGPPEEDEAMDVDGGMQQATEEDVPEGSTPEEDSNEDAVAQPDTHAGDGVAQDPSAGNTASSEATKDQSTEGQKPEQSAGDIGTMPGETSKVEDETTAQPTEREETAELPQAEPDSAQSASNGGSGTQRGTSNAIPQESRPLSNNPLRSLGDALREISQRFNEILESGSEGKTDRQEAKSEANKDEPTQLEYIHEDDTQDEMQALGPAGEEREAKLRELNLVDEEEPVTDKVAPAEEDAMDVDAAPSDVKKSSLDVQQTSESLQNGEESALTPAEIRGSRPGGSQDDLASVIPETQSTADMDDAEDATELALKQWQAEGQPSEQAEQIWRRYESLTHDLSYALCEQLRLILEPTMATRLKGDYRTGKRLNMKKIIPYIASEYTKDKIWLRRTRPSQREYQVLIALDDSKSMAESHSVHLAFQTLALVSKALSRLEVGDVAVAKFGQSVDVLHGFEAPFTDQAGTKIMDAFKFNQQATQVQSLLEASLTLLEQARERRAMSSSSAADLWQMEIIISDGICQDHERLRTVLRKAEEQRVMVVFIILDSLHTSNSTSASAKAANQNSILSMNQVAYKEVDGRMDLTVTRYLDTFPFEYYVVVRNVEALPDVLAGTLKQFFERISEE